MRDALRELVAAGLVTNDTVDALRDVLRWLPVFPVQRRKSPTPRAGCRPTSRARPVVQRRVNPRRLARWKRPDRGETATWGGRWSLVHGNAPSPEADDEPFAPSPSRASGSRATAWSAATGGGERSRRSAGATIYHELKRLEFRGEVRRGYFVAGLAGAQFALPEAVELLRSPPEAHDPVVFAASDPANVYGLTLVDGDQRDPLSRPRGAGALLVTIDGCVVLAAEGRGKRIRTAPDLSSDGLLSALTALVKRLVDGRSATRHRDIVVETIDGESATASAWSTVFELAGFKRGGGVLRYYPDVGGSA